MLGQLLQPAEPGSEPSLTGTSHRLVSGSPMKYFRKPGDKVVETEVVAEGSCSVFATKVLQGSVCGLVSEGLWAGFPSGNPTGFPALW